VGLEGGREGAMGGGETRPPPKPPRRGVQPLVSRKRIHIHIYGLLLMYVDPRVSCGFIIWAAGGASLAGIMQNTLSVAREGTDIVAHR